MQNGARHRQKSDEEDLDIILDVIISQESHCDTGDSNPESHSLTV